MTKDWHTFREIEAQPDIWASWGHAFAEQAATIQSWIAECGITRVWFTGAGTSAFIGDTIADALSARLPQVTFRSVATTDLVASPETYLTGAGKDLLVVSFGRSGNSSETVGTLKLLDRRAPAAHRLNVICNAGSALSTGTHRGPGTQATVVLPDACHDKGFAMTSSFTTMLLTALACFLPADEVLDRTTALSKAARAALQRPVETPNVSRAVFLGSGPFKGIARESALKVLELTAGRVVTSWDSALGFRHGPMAVMTESSLVVIFLSSANPTAQYDADIAADIRTQFPDAHVVTIGETSGDIQLAGTGEDIWNTALFVTYAQRLAALWSDHMGLNVDDPFIDGGNLSRVVSHVRLYV